MDNKIKISKIALSAFLQRIGRAVRTGNGVKITHEDLRLLEVEQPLMAFEGELDDELEETMTMPFPLPEFFTPEAHSNARQVREAVEEALCRHIVSPLYFWTLQSALENAQLIYPGPHMKDLARWIISEYPHALLLRNYRKEGKDEEQIVKNICNATSGEQARFRKAGRTPDISQVFARTDSKPVHMGRAKEATYGRIHQHLPQLFDPIAERRKRTAI